MRRRSPHADAELQKEMERWIALSSLTDDPIEHGDLSAGNAVPGLSMRSSPR